MNYLWSKLNQHRRRAAAGQAGFTMIELMVAMVIILTVLLSMAYVITGSLASTGCARQRNAADSLVSQVIEEIRALPYSTVAAGDDVSSTSPPGDPTFAADSANITYNSGTGVYTYTPTGETMPTNTSSTAPPAPIDPHTRTVSENNTTYTVKTYITNFGSVTGAYRVTAVAGWGGGSCRGIATSVSDQTVVQQPGATTSPCLSSATHPFPAPCQASFYSALNTGTGYLSIAPPNGYTSDAIAGIPLTTAQLSMPTSTCTLQIEQVTSGQCAVTGSAESLAVSGSVTQTSGGTSITCSDSSDPSKSDLSCTNASLGQSALSSLSSGDSGANTLTLASGSSTVDSGSVTDTIAASSNPSCTDLTGVTMTDGLPCDHTSITQAAGLTATAALYGGGVSMGSATLASIGPDTAAAQLFDYRSSGASYCTSTSGDGCVHSAAERSPGAVIGVGGIPSVIQSQLIGGSFGCNGY
ncbi:MAG: type IV pilus modification PilV family protein, partial [Acidimicrobiales bacterium]